MTINATKWIHLAGLADFDHLPHLCSAGIQTAETVGYRAHGGHWVGESRCVFQYTLSGYGLLDYYGSTYKVGPGQAFVIYKSLTDVCYYYDPENTEPWRFVFCDICNFNDVVQQLNARHGPVYDLGPESFLAKKLVALVDRQQKEEAIISSTESFGVCAEIIHEMCRIIDGKDKGEKAPIAIKARDLIFKHRTENIALPQIAAELGVSPEHLCREFKRHLNISPKQFHDQVRVKSVYELLANTQKPIKEVARECGFDNIANFTTFFKKHTGITPGKLRLNIDAPWPWEEEQLQKPRER